MENKEELPKEEKNEDILKNENSTTPEIISQEKDISQQTQPLQEQKPENTQVLPALPSKKAKQKMSVTDKFGLFFIIIGFIAMFLAFLPLISIFFMAFYYLMLVIILILTLFTLLLNENFRGWISGGESITNILRTFIPYCPYIFGGAIGMFVISLILFCFSKQKSRRIAGIALNILFLVFSGIGMGLILYFSNAN